MSEPSLAGPLVVLALAGAACVLVLLPGAAAGRTRARTPGRALGLPSPFSAGAAAATGLIALGAGIVTGVIPSTAVAEPSPQIGFAAVVAACALAALALRRRAVERQRARTRAAAAGAACELLVGELAAGTPPLVALRRVSLTEPMLESVAGAAVMGGDVPAALRQLAAVWRIGSWERVADGWEVSTRTGAGLTGVLAQVATAERDAMARRRLVQQELAEAQATARLMAVLPWILVAAGSLGGGGALSFLVGSWIGVISAAGGCTLAVTGLFWLERIERQGTAS